jgi:hypothetical protein
MSRARTTATTAMAAVACLVVAFATSALGRAFPNEDGALGDVATTGTGTGTTGTSTSKRSSTRCASAHASRWMIADERGYACAWIDVDRSSGCCDASAMSTRRFACDGCDARVGCCEAYETCVSCCLGPERDRKSAMRRHARGRNQVATGFFDDEFEYCANRCRTQPSVTVHENTYAYATKHCYGEYPVNEDPVPAKGKKAFAGDGPDES